MEHYNRSFCHSGDLVMCLIQRIFLLLKAFHIYASSRSCCIEANLF